MGHAQIVGRRLQTIVLHQQLVAPLGLAPFFGVQWMDCRAQVVGAVLARYTAHLPNAPFEAFDQRFEAFRKADLNRLDIRVHQHQVVDQVWKGHTAQRDAEARHVREVGLSGLARFVDLWKDHLALGTVLSPPRRNVPLQRTQLALLKATRVQIAQQTEQGLTL